MKAYVDNKLIKNITNGFYSLENKNLLIEACKKAEILKEVQNLHFILGWPSLFEYLGLNDLFVNLPKFDEQNKLYNFLISTLSIDPEKDLLIRLYDEVFVQCITQIRSLPEIDPDFLINQIQKARQFPLDASMKDLFSLSLVQYEKKFSKEPYHTIHDLTLYLAWDRVCVNFAIVFEHLSTNPQILNGLNILRECLIESYLHINAQGRTSPSFFRLIEALYAYDMRAENLQSHSDSDWAILCQSAIALRSRDSPADVFYIDAALKNPENATEVLKGFTLDPIDKVKSTLALARHLIEKLKLEIPEWQYTLCPQEIFCLKDEDNVLSVEII